MGHDKEIVLEGGDGEMILLSGTKLKMELQYVR